jgi:peptidoglycan/xylan/chitin deacetylase (PgdA/CDA1 family)
MYLLLKYNIPIQKYSEEKSMLKKIASLCKAFAKTKYIPILSVAAAAMILLTAVKPISVNVFSSLAASKRELPIYCVNTDKKKIAISFDAAWGADDTDTLLSILNENNVKATFFMCGYWVDKYPDEVKKICEAGHDLGNHSATHPHMNSLSSAEIKKELDNTYQKVYDLTGYKMNLFRAPFGEYNNNVINTAHQCGYNVIQWDVDTPEIK